MVPLHSHKWYCSSFEILPWFLGKSFPRIETYSPISLISVVGWQSLSLQHSASYQLWAEAGIGFSISNAEVASKGASAGHFVETFRIFPVILSLLRGLGLTGDFPDQDPDGIRGKSEVEGEPANRHSLLVQLPEDLSKSLRLRWGAAQVPTRSWSKQSKAAG